MRPPYTFIAVVVLAVFAASSTATRASPCETQGSKDAKEISLDLRDQKTLQGLRISFGLGLPTAKSPVAEISKITTPCSRGRFRGLFHGFELFGENNNSPPRWAIVNNASEPLLFVAMMPRPGPALSWYESAKPKGPIEESFMEGEWMWALVLSGSQSTSAVIAFFDQIPGDELLVSMMQKVGKENLRLAVGFNAKTRDVLLNTN